MAFHYLELLPSELETIQPLIDSYYTSIGTPRERARLDNYFNYLFNYMITNPQLGYVAKVIAGYREAPEYPLEFVGEAIGYIWFYITRNVHNEPFLFIEHLYSPGSPELVSGFLQIVLDYYKRSRCVEIQADAATDALETTWSLFGLKTHTRRMRFRCTGDELERFHFDRFKQYTKKAQVFRRRKENGGSNETRSMPTETPNSNL